jgi:hypothetical protein
MHAIIICVGKTCETFFADVVVSLGIEAFRVNALAGAFQLQVGLRGQNPHVPKPLGAESSFTS